VTPTLANSSIRRKTGPLSRASEKKNNNFAFLSAKNSSRQKRRTSVNEKTQNENEHAQRQGVTEEIKEAIGEIREEIHDLEDIIHDLEEFAERGEDIPHHAKKFRIRIDKIKYVVEVPEMSGRQLLELAGKVPAERFEIRQKFKGGKTELIGYDETADFRKKGIERFMTLPLDQTEGCHATSI
jgi:uncharacterized FlaG/YvyC family protein